MPRPLLGVAGFPVGHSRSPAMQQAALDALGLDWRYVKVPLPPARFEETVRALPASGFVGVNVTVPHKEAARTVADRASAGVEAIGAANTLTFEDDGAVVADNTDAPGFLAALATDPAGAHAIVLGAGGSARAVVWALAEAGAASISIWNRTPERARELAAQFDAEPVEKAPAGDLLVNCTSVGLEALAVEEALDLLGLGGAAPPATVVDLVYGDGPTPIERWAATGAARFVSGLEVLVHQGALSLERWTGQRAPIDAMRRALA